MTERVVRVPNAVDTGPFAKAGERRSGPPAAGEPLRCCSLGRLAVEKNPGLLLDAIAKVGHTSGWDCLAGSIAVCGALAHDGAAWKQEEARSLLGAFLYGGARIDYYTIPVRGKPLVLEAGADAGSIFLTPALALYGALDIKCRQEISWGTTQSYQLGLRLPGTGGRAVRVAYTYRTGADERGQFYREHLTCSLMGIYLDF